MATFRINTATDTTWTIDQSDSTWILGSKGSIVSNQLDYGIFGSNMVSNTTIRIDGEINLTKPGNKGIDLFSGGANRITVGEDGHISAFFAAIHYENVNGTVTIANDGLVENAIWGIVAKAKDGGIDVINSGRIEASFAGINAFGIRADIANSGTIRADYGIFAQGTDSATEWLAENAIRIVNTGKVYGSKDSINASGVAANIRNKGLLDGDVGMNAGNDVFNNRGGMVNGDISGGGNNDVFRMAGGTVNGDILGGSGDDTFRMVGGKLNGVVYGGSGSDVVTLNSQTIVYVERSGFGADTVRANCTYQLGSYVENLVLLGKGNFIGIGNSENNTLTGNKANNLLYGQGQQDTLIGGAGNDRLFGGEGVDTLDGGKGADILTGGANNDTFVFKRGYGRDTVTDFDSNGDYIDLTAYGFGSYSAVEARMIEKANGDLVIRFSDTDALTIRDGVGNVDMGDFLL